QLASRWRPDRPECAVHVILHAIQRERDEDRLPIAIALEFPHQVVPHVRRWRWARDTRLDPAHISGIPNFPLFGAANIALCAEDEFLAIQRLVHVELQRLWRARILDVEVNVVNEIPRA